MIFDGDRKVSYNLEMDLLWRMELVVSSLMLDLPGDRNVLMFDLAVLSQEGSFFGVVGSAESMLSRSLSQYEGVEGQKDRER